ncbi:MAG: VTT domain-containing protein [Xanthomonadales bacterium]|nr:VTT domain-containing protein [Xanthomonadales bacterium]
MLLVLLIALAAVFLPIEQIVMALREWATAEPGKALLGTMLFITIGFLLMLPSSLLMMLAGFLFGLVHGFAITWTAGLLASTAAFWIGRTAARPWVERLVRRKAVFIAIDRAIQHKGFLVVLLSRIVMLLPFPALNYTLGLTAVKFRDYLAGSNIGMIPPYFLFVYLGTTVSNVTAFLNGSISLGRNEIIVGALALAAIVLIVVFIVRTAARALKSELNRTASGP